MEINILQFNMKINHLIGEQQSTLKPTIHKDTKVTFKLTKIGSISGKIKI